MARKASGSQFGNMEWQARNYGYNNASDRPTVADIDALIAANMPSIKFTAEQHSELMESADYAYMLKLRHRAGKN